MEYYTLVATISLIFQVGVFILLLGGYILKQMQKLWLHGVVMLVALVLHSISIGAIMLPSFVSGIIPFIASAPIDAIMVLSIVHAITGIVAPVLAIWIVASWRLQRSMEHCMPKKIWMKSTFAVWLIALLSGFVMYLSFYWTLLFS
jgi:uncharacterized membrane protein YozB (DUF420 family)